MALRDIDLRRVRVTAVMTRRPATVDEQASLADAAAEIAAGGFRHVPVVNGRGRLVGMISERDLRARLGTDVAGFADVATDALSDRVGDAMTPDPITLPPAATLADALEIFADDRVGAVPVVDDADRLLGIVSYVDLLGAIRSLSAPPRAKRPATVREAPRRTAQRAAGRKKPRGRARRS
jgi:CBS domain-containing protein